MSLARSVALFAAITPASLLPAPLGAASKPRPDQDLHEVLMADGRRISLRLLTEAVEITTRYGKLKVPLADIRRIDVGLRYPEGVKARVEAAVARLGDADFAARQAAGAELLRLKELAYPALKQALKSTDLEIRRRATELVRTMEDTVPAELLQVGESDVVVTPLFPIVGRIEALVLEGHSPASGEVQVRVAEARRVRSVLSERALFERIRGAVGAGRVSRTQQMGTGKEPYEDVPKGGALLVGVEVTYGKFGASRTVKTVRPIFQTPDGRVAGTTRGVPGEDLVRVVARPGFAVGAVTIKAGLGVDGMSVTFMEIQGGRLGPDRSYDSEWLGGMGGGEKTKLAGSGAPVVGIFGKVADGPDSTFNGLGLVTATVDE
jgi:hypothetical protein